MLVAIRCAALAGGDDCFSPGVGAARAAPSAWQAGATPCHGVLNYAPNFERGVPTSWVYGWSIEYYNGRAIDVHGNPIGPEYHDGHFPAERFDPNDPPQFESEAAYLDRHSLLLPSERRRLPRADSSRQYCRLNSGPKLNEHGNARRAGSRSGMRPSGGWRAARVVFCPVIPSARTGSAATHVLEDADGDIALQMIGR